MGTLIDDLQNTVQECRRLSFRPDVTRIKLKEKLQFYVLDFIYNHVRYNQLIFYGGTCLRVCFQLNRMSEDIDFETTAPFDKKEFALEVCDYFSKHHQYGPVSAHVPWKNISRVELRFPVLHELGLSEHAGEKLLIKVEVNQIKDTYPTSHKALARDRFSLVIRHYDLPTLMAGKMLACLDRVWEKKGVRVKGRDYYDLLWYMENGVIPNGARLAASARHYSIQEAFDQIIRKVEKTKESDLLADLGSLFENGEFAVRWVATFKEQFRRWHHDRYRVFP